MAKNKRQPYAVYNEAGMQTSAESWGTGRAVARIPRVGGGGTHRSGQATGSNAARGGWMYSPTKVWRRWFVKVNQNQKRFATASALAATAIPSLLLARGHRVEQLEEVPLVVSDAAQDLKKTKEALALLQAVNAYPDVVKVSNSRKVRAGQGKLRNRRYKQRRGPLVVYNEDNGIVKAFRNLPGVELVSVHRLNLLQLAPGGHVGRFCIWTESAFKQLDTVFGTHDKPSEEKKGFRLPTAKIAQTDVTRIINSTEIQSAVRPVKSEARIKRPFTQKKNPLKNRGVLFRLNPTPNAGKKELLTDFLIRLYSVYVDLQFAYLEINPLVCTDDGLISYLDMAAKLDQTADFICGPKWSVARDPAVYSDKAAAVSKPAAKGEERGPPMVWPAPFGRDLTKEEAYIAKLDSGTGASLKLTVLNPTGRIWTMVAGGGASVVYSDAIAAHGFAHELANYGEYSGAPSEGQTYEYAKTLLDLMTRGDVNPQGKLLIIGGGIANFTNVASTFKGIIRALKQYKQALAHYGVKIFVRRGGPNYQEGLQAMRLLGEDLGVTIEVFGPDTHITDIVPWPWAQEARGD
ncbi:hypothetical protein L7F22_015890 [Adiantum nelumboides]|nr:hypothetical protein [Adiantum nelumboides]